MDASALQLLGGVGHRIGQWLHPALSLLPLRSQLGQSIAGAGGEGCSPRAALRAHHSCDNRSRFARPSLIARCVHCAPKQIHYGR
ncbi:hypothetical protein B5X24_HaOG205573 [Helicoverpa armigera]|uniref:Uncharacterized protein n=1 Tax=Helicoverpa armigera TaxID=29058 RepID=A0A2W1BNM0_HELAM|nr:hypothetical protein B5X24_HaOG205573 [Helicoverpa armigera]